MGGGVDEAGDELGLAAILGEVPHLAHVPQVVDGEARGMQHGAVRQVVLVVGDGVEEAPDENVLGAPRRLQIGLLAHPLQLRDRELVQRLVGVLGEIHGRRIGFHVPSSAVFAFRQRLGRFSSISRTRMWLFLDWSKLYFPGAII